MTSDNQASSYAQSEARNAMFVDLSNECVGEISEPPSKKLLLESGVIDPISRNYSSIAIGTADTLYQLPLLADEFKDPSVISRLRERMKTQLQSTVAQAVTRVLNDINNAVEDVNRLKKNTEDLQKRLTNIETVSRKVESIVNANIPLAHRYAPTSGQHDASGFNSSSQDMTTIMNSVQSAASNRWHNFPSSAGAASMHQSNSSYQRSSAAQVAPTAVPPATVPRSEVEQNPVSMAMAYVNHLANSTCPPHASVEQRTAPLPPVWKPVGAPGWPFSVPPVQPPARLSISAASEGVCLRWDLDARRFIFEPATSYQLYSYASSDVDPRRPLTSKIWQKVGDIEALVLPMACTLTSVLPNNVYYFVVRSTDQFQRSSEWSNVVNASVS